MYFERELQLWRIYWPGEKWIPTNFLQFFERRDPETFATVRDFLCKLLALSAASAAIVRENCFSLGRRKTWTWSATSHERLTRTCCIGFFLWTTVKGRTRYARHGFPCCVVYRNVDVDRTDAAVFMVKSNGCTKINFFPFYVSFMIVYIR